MSDRKRPDDESKPDDPLDLLHDPEPGKPTPEAIEDEGEPGGENFV